MTDYAPWEIKLIVDSHDFFEKLAKDRGRIKNMVEWNPVKGLKKIDFNDLRTGDDVVAVAYDGASFRRMTVKDVSSMSMSSGYYLLHREVKEPTGRGDLVELYRTNPRKDEDEEVEIYVRTRQKALDEACRSDEAWTSTDNDVRIAWADIVDRLGEADDFALRTYTATHKEVK